MEANRFARPRSVDRGASRDGEPGFFDRSDERLDVLPKKAFEKTGIDPALAAMNGFNDEDPAWLQDSPDFFCDLGEVEGVIEGIRVDGIERIRRVTKMMEIADNDVGIVRAGIQIDAGRGRAQVDESLHFGADARTEAEHAPAAPINLKRGQPFPKDAAKIGVVIPKFMGLEFGRLVFQVVGVGSVTTFLKMRVRCLPVFAKSSTQEAFPKRTLEPIESAHVLRVEGPDPVRF